MTELAFDSPPHLLEAAISALNLDDWAGFAGLFDPVSLRVFKHDVLETYLEEEEHFHFDADDLLEHEPDMPRAAAEYQASQMNQVTSKAHRLKRDFLTVNSVNELVDMDAGKMFALHLQSLSPYRRAALEPVDEEPWEADSAWEQPVDDGKKLTQAYRYSVVGSIQDGPDIAHVMYRDENTADKIFPEEYAVKLAERPADEQELTRQLHHHPHFQFATCRKQADGTWRLIADRWMMLVSLSRRV
jgi:hypothetical protein